MDAQKLEWAVATMRRKGDTELQRIWRENDRETWSEEAFEAVRQVLAERGVALPARPAAGRPEYQELVTLTTFTSNLEAEVARGVLESEGIPVLLANEVLSRVRVVSQIYWIHLRVPPADAARAAELLGLDL